jgi:DNA-binding NtrC family response regulator
MRRVFEQIQMARQSDVPVHFVGPRGAGKEHLARAVHHEGDSPLGAFVPLDCQQSPFELLEILKRLLHPHADDAPVTSQHPRTLYLNDITHLSRDVQERLLAVYRDEQQRMKERVRLPRLMSSSTESLAAAVADDRLLPDFYFLLTPLVIEVPALRQRMDDLTLLAQAFLESLNRGVGRQLAGFSDPVWPQLREYQWPGNLDELLLVVQEARDNSSGAMIEVKDLPLRFRAGLDAQSIGPMQRNLADEPIPPLESHLATVERDLITRALAQTKQNKTLAAKLLGIPRPVLYRRMDALGLSSTEKPGDEA